MPPPELIKAPTRRAVLGGLFTLAVAPALGRPPPGLTPMETALEELRHAHLARCLDPRQDCWPTMRAVQGLRELGLAPKDFVLYCRLAFRMGRLDSIRVKNIQRPVTQSEAIADGVLADLLRQRWQIEGDLNEAMRALPWPPGWAEQEAAAMQRA